MKRTLFPLVLLTVMTAGCAASVSPRAPQAAPAPRPVAQIEVEPREDAKAAPAASEAPSAIEAPARQPGDFIVYKFSGAFRKTPASLTERVVARQKDLITIDMTLEDTSGKRSIRVTMNDAGKARGEVASVARLEAGKEIAASLDVYDAFLAATSIAADANEGTLGTEDVTVDVGGSAYAGKKTSYRVRLGKRSAIMSATESTTLPWGDLGGEIKTKDGKLLYRAEVVELGHAAPIAAAVATSDLDD